MTMNGMFNDKPRPVTLDEMVACAKRELAMRKSVYPRWVKAGKMKQASADNEIRVMQGIVGMLLRMQGDAPVKSEVVRCCRSTSCPTCRGHGWYVRLTEPLTIDKRNADALAGLGAFQKAKQEHFGG